MLIIATGAVRDPPPHLSLLLAPFSIVVVGKLQAVATPLRKGCMNCFSCWDYFDLVKRVEM